jgi:hypothetical protein
MAKPKKGVVPPQFKKHMKKAGGAKKSNTSKPAFLMKGTKGTKKSGRKR